MTPASTKVAIFHTAAKQAAADEKIANLDPEKAAKVKAALEAKAAREAAKTETEKEGE